MRQALPSWVTRALIWALALILIGAGTWVSGIPSLGTRVNSLEREQAAIREEIRHGFRDVTERIDRLMDRRR